MATEAESCDVDLATYRKTRDSGRAPGFPQYDTSYYFQFGLDSPSRPAILEVLATQGKILQAGFEVPYRARKLRDFIAMILERPEALYRRLDADLTRMVGQGVQSSPDGMNMKEFAGQHCVAYSLLFSVGANTFVHCRVGNRQFWREESLRPDSLAKAAPKQRLAEAAVERLRQLPTAAIEVAFEMDNQAAGLATESNVKYRQGRARIIAEYIITGMGFALLAGDPDKNEGFYGDDFTVALGDGLMAAREHPLLQDMGSETE
jgi:hypothetical protein